VTETSAKSPRVIRGLDAEQRRLQRREALLDAGLDLFSAQGFQRTSIEQLCQHAYVGTKAFYETFASRDDLYSALLSRVADTALGGLAEFAEAHAGAADLEELVLEEFAHRFIDDVRVAKVTFGEGSAITPEAERQRRRNRRLAAAFVESLWQQSGADDIPDGVAIGLIGGLFDIIADWVLDLPDDGASPADVETVLARMKAFYAAVRGPAS